MAKKDLFLVKGKYLKQKQYAVLLKHLFYILFLFSTYVKLAKADAWLAPKGQYKIITEFAEIDKISKKNKKEILSQIHDLRQTKMNLYKDLFKLEQSSTVNFATETKMLLNNKLERIEHEIKELRAMQDHRFASFTVEYGASDDFSFGTKLEANYRKFGTEKSTGKAAEIFCKRKVFANENYILTLTPSLYLNNSYQHEYRSFIMLNARLGHSNNESFNWISSFSELGLTIGQGITKLTKNERKYKFIINDGILFGDLFMWTNYIELEKHFYDKNKALHKYYVKTSLAKDLHLGKTNTPNITISFGYFAKGTFTSSKYNLSGPAISLWMTI